MSKKYMKPALEVVEIELEQSILGASTLSAIGDDSAIDDDDFIY